MTLRDHTKPLLLALGLFIYIVFLLSPNSALVKGHTGWVTSHNLAIANHTTMHSGYVGYTEARNNNGKVEYEYFARSPIFTYVLIKLGAESFSSNKVEELLHSRVFLRACFVVLILLSLLLLLKITSNNFWLSGGVVLAIFSSQYFLTYKDLVSPDMFTNLGFVTCIWGIYFYEKNKYLLGLFLIFLSLNLGWGYSILPLIGVWSVWSFLSDRKLKNIFNKKLIVFVCSIFYIAVNVIYNCHQEAKLNNVSIYEVGIIKSAISRLGINPTFNEGLNYPYYRYLTKLIDRFYRSFALPDADWSMVVTALPFVFFILFGLFRFYKSGGIKNHFNGLNKQMLLMLPLASLLWALPMKNLFVPHGYTTMNLFGVFLFVFLLAALALLKGELVQKRFFYLMLGYFVLTHGWVNYQDKIKGTEAERLVYEYSRIAQFLGPEGLNICVENEAEVIPGAPYSASFFLSQHVLAQNNNCAYKVSKDASYSGENLVSQNQLIFLTKVTND